MKRSVEAALDSQPGRFRKDLERELLTLLFATTPVVLVTNLINGTLIAVVFFRANAPPVVATWWMFLLAMISVRAAVHSWLQRRGRYDQWGVHIAIIGSGIAGVLWGTAGLLFYSPTSETQRMVLGFVLGGMGAGAVTALTPCLPAFYAYLFPSLVPFCVRLTLEGDLDHLTMSAMCVLYLVALVILGRRANMWLTESLSHRFDNAELIQSLEHRVEERTAELREVNEQLEQDITERKRAETALADHWAPTSRYSRFRPNCLVRDRSRCAVQRGCRAGPGSIGGGSCGSHRTIIRRSTTIHARGHRSRDTCDLPAAERRDACR